jgi:hypothetical protein
MLESPIYCIEEVSVAKWFVQKCTAPAKGSRIAICVRRDKDDRYMPVGLNHMTLEIKPIHARHSHVENQARRIMCLTRTQERFRRRKTSRPKSDGSDQIVERILSESSSSTIEMSGTLAI